MNLQAKRFLSQILRSTAHAAHQEVLSLSVVDGKGSVLEVRFHKILPKLH